MSQTSEDSLIGATIAGKYRVVELLGKGRFGKAYRVDPVDPNDVAERPRPLVLKLLPKTASRDLGYRERFTKDIRVAKSVDNKYIVPIRDAGLTELGRLYHVMDFCPGTSLCSVLRKEGKFPIPRALRLARKVLRALEAAHSTGLVHGDISPSTVFVVAGDGNRSIRVLDFGVPSWLGDGRARGWRGTPAYMPPEQLARHRLSFASDLYSVGVILYESITGVKLYPGTTPQEMLELFEKPAAVSAERFVPEVAAFPGLAETLKKAIALDPSQRFQTAREFTRAIQRVLKSELEEIPATPVRASPPTGENGATPKADASARAHAAPEGVSPAGASLAEMSSAPRSHREAFGSRSRVMEIALPVGVLLYCVVFSGWIHDAFAESQSSEFYVDFAMFSVIFIAVFAILVRLNRRWNVLGRVIGRFRRSAGEPDGD